VKNFTLGHIRKGPVSAPVGHRVKRVMLTLRKQGVVRLLLAPDRERCITWAPLRGSRTWLFPDYLRYGAVVSRPPAKPAEQPDPQPSGDAAHGSNEFAVRRPLGVYVISVVAGLQSLSLAVAGVVFTVGVFTQPSFSLAGTIFLIVLVFALAAALAAVAVNAYKGYRWTRSAAFVWQLLMVAIAVPALLNGSTLIGLVMLLPALAVIFYLFTPRVVDFSLRTGGGQPLLEPCILGRPLQGARELEPFGAAPVH
jgi:hypothetical protein